MIFRRTDVVTVVTAATVAATWPATAQPESWAKNRTRCRRPVSASGAPLEALAWDAKLQKVEGRSKHVKLYMYT